MGLIRCLWMRMISQQLIVDALLLNFLMIRCSCRILPAVGVLAISLCSCSCSCMVPWICNARAQIVVLGAW
jgi:hypothetical protein